MINLTKMIYICSPYSSGLKSTTKAAQEMERMSRYTAVTKLIGEFQDEVPYAFIGPITQSHQTAKYMKSPTSQFEAWKNRDLTYISKCDEVWVMMMDGWDRSEGVREEIKFAKALGIPILFYKPELNTLLDPSRLGIEV